MIAFIFALMIAVTVLFIIFPLMRLEPDAAERQNYDIAVYRDQLREVEGDIKRGIVAPEEAEAARLEIQRRILTADILVLSNRPLHPQAQKLAIVLICVVVAFGSLGVYLYLGSPELQDRPYISREDDPDFRLNVAAEKMAVELAGHPDAEGYRRVGGMFYALHRYDIATEDFQKSIDLGTNDASLWSQLGESIVMQNNGMVVMEALNAFKTALKSDPSDSRAGFYVGLAETQIGNLKKAVAIWRKLEEGAPEDAPWLPMVRDNIMRYAEMGGFDPMTVAPEAPNLK